MKILKKRKGDLDKKDMKKLINDLFEDISFTYRNNYEKIKSKKMPVFLKTIIYIIVIVLFGYIYYHFIKHNFSTMPKNEKFIKIEMSSQIGKKIKEFINQNKNKNLKKIMKNTCLICLNDFDQKENNNILFEYNDSSNEKIVLPCDHIFHLKCISHIFKNSSNCPLCKSKFQIDDNKDGKIIINNYFLNSNWSYNNSIIFKDIIKDFLKMQKNINPDEINDNYCSQIIDEYENNKDFNFFKKVKIFNIN
jgi:hypothetical protein